MAELGTLRDRPLTTKGRETRQRIVEAAAELMVERGVAVVSLDQVGRMTATSKSQMYHYFTSKDELVAAVVTCVGDRILGVHKRLLASVQSVDDLQVWADSILAFQRQASQWSGCPLGTLAIELSGEARFGRPGVQQGFASWQLLLQDAFERLKQTGELRTEADPASLALATLASLQGGLLMSKALQSEAPLAAALDAAVDHVRSFAAAA